MDKSIFRAYDIRGIYPTELDELDAYKIARAVFEYLKPKKVAIGRDARLSAPVIHQAVCRGFLDAGCSVTDLGMTSTDMISFAVGALDFDLAINITASHNPKEWIGLKISQRGGDAVGGAGEIQEIAKIVFDHLDDWQGPSQSFGAIKKLDILPQWIDHLLSLIDHRQIKPLKIVVDAGNGVAGPIVRALFEKLPVKLVELYLEPDGNFPNHLPSPIEPENTADLQKKVVETGADLGMALDGDADRVFLVDEKGERVSGSEMTAMVMDMILSQDPTRVVLYNAVCGWNVRDVIKKHNAKAFRTKVGHGYIKKDMRRYNAFFAGEHSGHYFFKDNFGADSGLIAALLVLALLSRANQPLSEVLKPYRQYFSIPETNFKVDDVSSVIEKIEKHYRSLPAGLGQKPLKIDYLDGITIEFSGFWFNLRPSSNEPLLRLNLEAVSSELLEQKKKELVALLSE